MSKTKNKILREGYDRLKKTWQKILKPDKVHPQLVLQPIPNPPAGKQIKNI
jgi:hypothetical protein